MNSGRNMVDNYFGMNISQFDLDLQERMLAGGHRTIVLLVPPSLSLLHLCLGVPLHQSRQLLCLDLTASVGAINLIVLGWAVQSFDENGCVFVVAVHLHYTCAHRRMQKQIHVDIMATTSYPPRLSNNLHCVELLTFSLVHILTLLEVQKPSPGRWSVFSFWIASLNDIPLSTLT